MGRLSSFLNTSSQSKHNISHASNNNSNTNTTNTNNNKDPSSHNNNNINTGENGDNNDLFSELLGQNDPLFDKDAEEDDGKPSPPKDLKHLFTRLHSNYQHYKQLIVKNTGMSYLDTTDGTMQFVTIHPLGSKASDLAQSINHHNTTLTTLILPSNQITDDGGTKLVNALSSTPQLQVTKLDLSNNRISTQCATAIGSLLEGSNVLQWLDVSGNNIGDAGGYSIANGVAKNTSLKSLYMNNSRIGEYGIVSLSTAMYTNDTIVDLQLNGNFIGSDDGAERLSAVLFKHEPIRSLHCGGCGLLSAGVTKLIRILESGIKLQTLALWNNGINNDTATTIANALTVNRSLTSLILRRNEIGDDGVGAIAASLVANTTLRSLDLGGNEISDHGVNRLCTVLSTECQLTELDLSANKLGEHSALNLAATIGTKKSSLIVLNLSHNNINRKGLKGLVDAVDVNDMLVCLYVSRCGGSTSSGGGTDEEYECDALWQSRVVFN